MQNAPSKPSAARVYFCWLGEIVGLNIRVLLSRMAKILSSMLYQAVRGKIILGWVTFPGYVPYPAMVTLPKLMKFTQPGYGYPSWVKLPRLGNFTQPG